MGMIGGLEITLIVPTLRVGMPLRTLRVRSRMWRRCVDKLQHYPRHALGSMNPQSVPFVTRSVTGGMPTQSDGHDQCWGGLVCNDERSCVVTPPRTLRSAAQALETVETVRLFMLAPNQSAQGKPVRVTGFGDAARQRQRFVVEPGGEQFGAQRGGDQST